MGSGSDVSQVRHRRREEASRKSRARRQGPHPEPVEGYRAVRLGSCDEPASFFDKLSACGNYLQGAILFNGFGLAILGSTL